MKRLCGLCLMLVLTGCAGTTDLTPARTSMPAARAALRPELRIFYDALQDYGDWMLIEPYGYVFRPSISIAEWQPYSYGFWVPSDLYGWVWISSEPFGWATYHYGRWFNDSFQGWVWVPGNEWGPAWVGWQQSNSYVGWSPLTPGGGPFGKGYQWAPTAMLGSTDLHAHVASTTQLGARLGAARAVQNSDRLGTVSFNRGPVIEEIERVTGPLARVRIDDSVVPGAPQHTAGTGGRAPARPTLVEDTRRAALQAAQEASALAKQASAPPPQIRLVRPIGVPGRVAPAGVAPAPPDSVP